MNNGEILAEFFKFLKENGAYDRFMANSIKRGNTCIVNNTISVGDNGFDIIDCSLYWARTPEGESYWDNLNNKWNDKLRELRNNE